MLIISNQIRIPLEEFRYTHSRSGGPGGQNVNKVNTKVTLHWNVKESSSITDAIRERIMRRFHRRMNKQGELVITSQKYREQSRNLQVCLDKLREIVLAASEVPKARKPTRPTKASKERRLEAKRQTAKRKSQRRISGDGSD